MYLNWFHVRTEKCLNALLVENYGLNTKHCCLIMTILYRVLSLECNVFKLVSCKDRKMLACPFFENYGFNTKQHCFIIMEWC
jgi:hypothetical protein